jgi:hypothetical protein
VLLCGCPHQEFGLEVTVDKTKYMVMSRHQNAGQSHSIKTGNNFYERVEEFKCLEKKLEQIKIIFRKKLRTG